MAVLKFPAPYYGGKSDAAPCVWAALGDVPQYVEPFCGSCAVLLRRPHPCNRPYYSETVNDADGFLVNALRALRSRPEKTAEAASIQVAEAELMSRHLWLLGWAKEGHLERLMADPDWCDPVAAGYWLWGLSCWIGGGWCDGSGPWAVGEDGRVTRRSEPGVSRRRPHVSSNGKGVNHPNLREPGAANADMEYHPMTMPGLRQWFLRLSARLRHVRILNGDWSRAVTSGATITLSVRKGLGPCGVFLDPPYSEDADRDNCLYRVDSKQVAHDVRDWCLAHGDDPRYRIVLAGYEGEHEQLTRAGWRQVAWFRGGWLKGGYGNLGDGNQQHRERLWLSPHCLRPVEQRGLFE